MKISLIIFLHVYLHGVVEILETECENVEIFRRESTLERGGAHACTDQLEREGGMW